MTSDPKDPYESNSDDSENDSSDDEKEISYYIGEVESAMVVSELEGKLVGNVVKSYMTDFVSTDKFAEMLKKAGHIVRIVGGKFTSRLGSGKDKPRSR